MGNAPPADFAFDLGGDGAKLTDFSLNFPLLFRFRMPDPSTPSVAVGVFDLTGLEGSESPVLIGLMYDTRVFDEPAPTTCPFEVAGGVIGNGFPVSLGVTRLSFENDFDKGVPFSNVWDLRFDTDIGFGAGDGWERLGEPAVVTSAGSNVLALRIGTGVCGLTGVPTTDPVPGQRSITEVFF